MTGETERSEGWGGESRLFQQGELRVLTENTERQTQLFCVSQPGGAGSRRQQMKFEFAEMEALTPTAVKPQWLAADYRIAVLWAHGDTQHLVVLTCNMK